MSLEFNDKGKYFTDIITKTPVAAVIQTTAQRIEGFVHVRVGGRLKDELDLKEAFLAVTSARVFSQDGALLYETEFLSVARAQIVWVFPSPAQDDEGGQA